MSISIGASLQHVVLDCQIAILSWSISQNDPTHRVCQLASVSKCFQRVVSDDRFIIKQLQLKQRISFSRLRYLTNHISCSILCSRELLTYAWDQLCCRQYVRLIETPGGWISKLLGKEDENKWRNISDWIGNFSPHETTFVSTFNFKSYAIKSEFVSRILHVLPNVTNLTFNATHVSGGELTSILESCPKIVNLEIAIDSQLEPSIFFVLLPSSSQLQCLHLVSNDEGESEISADETLKFMRSSGKLTSLKLPARDIDTWLEECLIRNRSLTQLDLSNGTFSDTLCTSLASKCHQLHSLHMNIRDPLTNKGLMSIFENCPSLVNITLYQDFVGWIPLSSINGETLSVIKTKALKTQNFALKFLIIHYRGYIYKDEFLIKLPLCEQDGEELAQHKINFQIIRNFNIRSRSRLSWSE